MPISTSISSLGAAHVAAALAALVFGALVLAMRKGTQLHRAMGMAYAAAMVALNLAALMIYRITGHFGPFHVLALLSLATLVSGVLAVVRRRPGWLSKHYQRMSFSYLGLLSAGTTQMLVNLPPLHGPMRGTMTGVASAVVFVAAGAIILPRLRRRALATVASD
jgi:uncharacterized membrane protein